MKFIVKVFFCILFFVLFFGCKKESNDMQTILEGSASISVDESLSPIIEEQIAVFESEYKGKISLIAKSESEISVDLLKGKSDFVVLSRKLNKSEINYFEKKKIKPRVTPIATDAIALVSNKRNMDTLVAVQDILDFMKGVKNTKIKGLVFDNPNSSTMRYFLELANLENIPKSGVFYFKYNEEVIKYVSENDGVIGLVGLSWLYRPSAKVEKYLENVNVLNVKGIGAKEYCAPSQNNIAEGIYPLARDLFIINCQGSSGLGMGFSSFIAGDIGQRIVLKSGLLPFSMPGRKILIKN